MLHFFGRQVKFGPSNQQTYNFLKIMCFQPHIIRWRITCFSVQGIGHLIIRHFLISVKKKCLASHEFPNLSIQQCSTFLSSSDIQRYFFPNYHLYENQCKNFNQIPYVTDIVISIDCLHKTLGQHDEPESSRSRNMSSSVCCALNIKQNEKALSKY